MKIALCALAMLLLVGCSRNYTVDRADGMNVGTIDLTMTPFGDTVVVKDRHGKTIYECNWIVRASCWEVK